MAETPTDVLVAGYQDIDEATKDFEALVALVKEKKVSIEGVILVTHAEDGSVCGAADRRQPRPQGNGLGRRRRARGRPLRAAAARVGRRRGGRRQGDRRVRRQQGREGASGQDRREPATRIGRDHRDLRRRAAGRGRAGARGRAAPVGRPGRQAGHRRIEGVARRGDGEVQPGPHGAADPGSELRGRDRPNPGHVRRRLDDRHDAVAAGGRAERVARADRRRRLRQPVDVRRARLDPDDDAGRRPGPQVQPVPRRRAVLAHAGRPADRSQPPHGRVRVARRVPRPVPRLLGERAEGLRSVRPRAPGQRLHDSRVRQVAHDPRPRPGCSRAVRPLAERVGIRSLLGHPRRRGGPVRPADHAGQHDRSASRRPRTARSTTGRTTSPIRRWAGSTGCARRTRRSRGSSTTRPGARTRRTRSRSSGARSTAASSTRAGTCSARRRSNGRRRSA